MLPEPPFTDSRRLTGANPWFAETGAALETSDVVVDAALLDGWRARIARARTALGWSDGPVLAREHAQGASLAFAAPIDQLYAATDVNEWAWLASVDAAHADIDYARFHAPGYAAVWDEACALITLRALADSEASPALIALTHAAAAHRLAFLIDDDALTIGEGISGCSWPLDALPDAAGIDWTALHDIPIALVTGTNGKTTTVRLLAAMARAHGWRTGYSCTDGLFVDGTPLEAGDYSGPMGARAVLRQSDVQAAILETARGGILRRGLAVQHARVAIVTNVSADHYGAYGVHDLDALARVKLTLARVLDRDGLLVLNVDDASLRAHAASLDCMLGWFALDDHDAFLEAHRARGGATCGVRDGCVWLTLAGAAHELGAIDAMPLTAQGQARYNIANILAASLAASALGIAPTTIAEVLARFGAAHADNPGRLQRWSLGGVSIWLDYAHNPDGLGGLLQVACTQRAEGRLALLLGQAGDRTDADIRALATTAAAFHPARVVLKDIAGYMRGRASGDVAAILRDGLLAAGIVADAVDFSSDEAQAVRDLLQWARPGDTLVLPIHGEVARVQVVALLDHLAASDWHPQQPLPSI
jgi:cyanophycin synthetase